MQQPGFLTARLGIGCLTREFLRLIQGGLRYGHDGVDPLTVEIDLSETRFDDLDG